ncbi:hypothetical protein [Streptomyces sp. WAC06614]|uniref:hypothetical protein n=1 Tax=Streptomyces sp. WAC06614 TaxID=2487416 RepID=UPI000F798FAD|nr:hypothetical protein [Streptomyces sp. WAC06614]RSS78580.1 hypothetical protein EF918_20405 [Streptomyces sp. WAC06614]
MQVGQWLTHVCRPGVLGKDPVRAARRAAAPAAIDAEQQARPGALGVAPARVVRARSAPAKTGTATYRTTPSPLALLSAFDGGVTATACRRTGCPACRCPVPAERRPAVPAGPGGSAETDRAPAPPKG